ncbi:hypothetical protein I4F81_008363 [Pyropia yezoensis]|uniref:Uncharacterized protein n=1 Tax=Pyropia yezoensis TaxID=2788 RepID=A0ACC3C6V8_PYRYE|nr:hypothetical protein I4F81_008363 [Neopyropia yezoensis]
MNRGVLAALRRILAALWAVVLAMTVVFPSSSEALREYVEDGDHTLSTFDDALCAFLDGSTGLQPLKAVAIARDSSPPRSWAPSRMVAATVSLFNGLSDPTRALKRLTGQLWMWRELNQAMDLDTKGGSEPVNDEAARAFLRSFLAALAAEGEGGGATGAEPHGGDDSRAPA